MVDVDCLLEFDQVDTSYASMPIRLYNEIEINCQAEKLFNYVTEPWRWHEWHPDSKGARADKQALSAGAPVC